MDSTQKKDKRSVANIPMVINPQINTLLTHPNQILNLVTCKLSQKNPIYEDK